MQPFVRLLALASFLSLIPHACARIVGPARLLENTDDNTSSQSQPILKRLAEAFGHVATVEKRQNQICVNDTYAQVLANNPAAQPFCLTLIGAPTQTIETDYTPVMYT